MWRGWESEIVIGMWLNSSLPRVCARTDRHTATQAHTFDFAALLLNIGRRWKVVHWHRVKRARGEREERQHGKHSANTTP